MSFQSLLTQSLTRSTEQPANKTEEALKTQWLALPESLTPVELATEGGFLASSLSHLFLLAYQAAVQDIFPGLEHQWHSFAVSEDKSGEYPGTSIHEGALSGSKSWIAGVKVIDRLIVTVGTDTSQCYLVDAKDPTVTLSARENPGFLEGMSQGFAHFTNTIPLKVISTEKVKYFTLAEPYFVTIAACGFLAKQFSRAENVEKTNQLQALWQDLTSLGDYWQRVPELAKIYHQVKLLGREYSSMTLSEEEARDWQTNGRLLGLYGKALERQAG